MAIWYSITENIWFHSIVLFFLIASETAMYYAALYRNLISNVVKHKESDQDKFIVQRRIWISLAIYGRISFWLPTYE